MNALIALRFLFNETIATAKKNLCKNINFKINIYQIHGILLQHD